MTPRQAVVTSLLGGYETLSPQPVARASRADFLCFTDDPALVSDDWRIVVVPIPFPQDPPRSQRCFKMLGDPLLDGYDEVLYIDNSVQLRVDPSPSLHDWLDGVDLASILHSFHDTVAEEFEAVLRFGLDDPARVNEQLLHYSLQHPEVLQEHPSWNGMFAYRPGPLVREAMTSWFWHVLRYSRRDQLSWNATVGASNLRIRRLRIDNHTSELHSWPPQVGRVPRGARKGPAVGPLAEEVSRLDGELRRMQGLQAELDALNGVQGRLLALQGVHEQLEATRATLSWRLTAPLRRVRTATGRRVPQTDED